MKRKIDILSFITVFFVCINFVFAQDFKRIAEHHQDLKTATNDSTRLIALTRLADKYCEYNIDSTLKYANLAIDLSRKSKRVKSLSYAYNSLGDAYWYKENFQKAQENYFKAYQISDSLDDKKAMALALYSMGWIFCVDQKDLSKINYLHKARQLSTEIKDTRGLSNAYQILARAFIVNYQYEPENKLLYDSALYYCSKQKELKTKLSDYYFNMTQLMYYANDFNSAVYYGNRELEWSKDKKDTNDVLIYITLSKINLNQTNKTVLAQLDELYNYYTKIGANTRLVECYKGYALYYYKIKDYKQAYDYGMKYYDLKNKLDKKIYTSDLANLKDNYETGKTTNKLQELEHEKELEEQKNKTKNYLLLAVFAGIITVLGFVYSLRKQNKQKHAANILLEQKNHIIEEKQKEILDSINYAKRIQDSLLATKSLLEKHIPNNFVYFNPKDIVSGDFYWATEHNNCFYLAVCDSTGHGVPGAFMSFLNMAYLSESISEKNIEDPAEIFNYVRHRLINTISKEGQKDGMDGILLCINKLTNTITYSAANNAPILISNNEIIELPKDKMPIGKGEKTNSFTTHTIQAKSGDVLYLYTDGYADQFGGDKGKKFKYKPLNELLIANHNKLPNEQFDILKKTFDNWKGNLEQVDDVLVMGIVL